jgi:hypothetical protein
MEHAWRGPIADGAHILAVADAPEVEERTVACSLRKGITATSDECRTSEAAGVSHDDPLVIAAADDGARGGVSLFETKRFYCPDEGCPSIIGNVIVYADALAHITGTFSQTLGPYLATAIQTRASS